MPGGSISFLRLAMKITATAMIRTIKPIVS